MRKHDSRPRDKAVSKRDRPMPWPPGAYVLVRKDNQSVFKKQVIMAISDDEKCWRWRK